jgi:hypothetical protein
VKGACVAISQNARFVGEAAPDAEFEHPPGASIARLLQDALAKRGWQVSDIDIWRDSGWSITCSRPASKLELVIAQMAVGEEWLLQIAPSYVPGLFGWLFGKPASALPDDIQAVAKDAFTALSDCGRFGRFTWCWDGFPDETNSTPGPAPARGST